MSYKTIRNVVEVASKARDFKTSSIDLLGGDDSIQCERTFRRWDTSGIWTHLLYNVRTQHTQFDSGYIWFDIFLWSPQNNSFIFKTILKPEAFGENLARFVTRQERLRNKMLLGTAEPLAHFLFRDVPPEARKSLVFVRSKDDVENYFLGLKQGEECFYALLKKGHEDEVLRNLILEIGPTDIEINENFIENFVQYLKLLNEMPNWSTFIFIPIPSIFPTSSGFCLAMEEFLTIEDCDSIVSEINGKSFILEQYVESWARDSIYLYAIKTAISTIMSRNLSHNIGSHVMTSIEKKAYGDSEDAVMKELEDLKHFSTYLRTRMDFLSVVATIWPSWSFPMRFLQDIMYVFFQQMPLLEYIGSSEGITENKLKFYFHLPSNGGEIVFIPTPENEYFRIASLRKILRQCDEWISVRGSVIGNHALYIIFENIIRNSSKHSAQGKGDLQIHIRLKKDTVFYRLEIWDNVSKCDFSKYYTYKIVMKNRDNILSKTNIALNEIAKNNTDTKIKHAELRILVMDAINPIITNEIEMINMELIKKSAFDSFVSILIANEKIVQGAEKSVSLILDKLKENKYLILSLINTINVSEEQLKEEVKNKLLEYFIRFSQDVMEANLNAEKRLKASQEKIPQKRGLLSILDSMGKAIGVTSQAISCKIDLFAKKTKEIDSPDQVSSGKKDIIAKKTKEMYRLNNVLLTSNFFETMKRSVNNIAIAKLLDVSINPESIKITPSQKKDNDGIIMDIIQDIEESLLNSEYNADTGNKDVFDDETTKDLIRSMNSKIMTPIIDEMGGPQKENWGIAEMKIASAFIQKKNQNVLGEKGEKNLDILDALPEFLDGSFNLKYVLTLPMPKEVLIIDFQGYERLRSSEDLIRGRVEVRRHSIQELEIIFEKKDKEWNKDMDIDYEFMVIIPPNDVMERIELLTEIFDSLTVNIEKLPTRLFLIGNENDFNCLGEMRLFAKKRIAIIDMDKEEFISKLYGTDTNSDSETGFKSSENSDKTLSNFKIWLYVK